MKTKKLRTLQTNPHMYMHTHTRSHSQSTEVNSTLKSTEGHRDSASAPLESSILILSFLHKQKGSFKLVNQVQGYIHKQAHTHTYTHTHWLRLAIDGVAMINLVMDEWIKA